MNLVVDKQKHEKYILKKYDTPKMIGIKGRRMLNMFLKIAMLAKMVQYTVIDEASRERFIYYYKEQLLIQLLTF